MSKKVWFWWNFERSTEIIREITEQELSRKQPKTGKRPKPTSLRIPKLRSQ